MLKIETTNRHYIQCSGHLQDTEIEAISLQSSSKNVSILMRDNKVFAEITGAKVNRGAGSGSPMCLPALWT